MPFCFEKNRRTFFLGPAALLGLVSGRAEFQKLNRFEILHPAAHALGRVEKNIRLGRIGIAQNANALAIDDQIAALEITKGQREAVGGNIRHGLGFRHRETHESSRAFWGSARLPDIAAAGILQPADGRLRAAVQHETGVLTIARFQRIDEVTS